MMTATAVFEHAADAHDGEVSDRWLTFSHGYVALNGSFADGATWREPVGKVSDPGVFEEACRAAGVVASRLTEEDGVVSVALTYSSGVTESEMLCSLEWRGAWRFIPCELFEAFEELVDGLED